MPLLDLCQAPMSAFGLFSIRLHEVIVFISSIARLRSRLSNGSHSNISGAWIMVWTTPHVLPRLVYVHSSSEEALSLASLSISMTEGLHSDECFETTSKLQEMIGSSVDLSNDSE